MTILSAPHAVASKSAGNGIVKSELELLSYIGIAVWKYLETAPQKPENWGSNGPWHSYSKIMMPVLSAKWLGGNYSTRLLQLLEGFFPAILPSYVRLYFLHLSAFDIFLSMCLTSVFILSVPTNLYIDIAHLLRCFACTFHQTLSNFCCHRLASSQSCVTIQNNHHIFSAFASAIQKLSWHSLRCFISCKIKPLPSVIFSSSISNTVPPYRTFDYHVGMYTFFGDTQCPHTKTFRKALWTLNCVSSSKMKH